jgi:hypothetical protein
MREQKAAYLLIFLGRGMERRGEEMRAQDRRRLVSSMVGRGRESGLASLLSVPLARFSTEREREIVQEKTAQSAHGSLLTLHTTLLV